MANQKREPISYKCNLMLYLLHKLSFLNFLKSFQVYNYVNLEFWGTDRPWEEI